MARLPISLESVVTNPIGDDTIGIIARSAEFDPVRAAPEAKPW